jgi:hypothetical protein
VIGSLQRCSLLGTRRTLESPVRRRGTRCSASVESAPRVQTHIGSIRPDPFKLESTSGSLSRGSDAVRGP